MYIGGIHDHGVVRHELLRGNDACAAEVGEDTLEPVIDIDSGVLVEAELNVERHAVGAEDVVVVADAVEGEFLAGEVDPVVTGVITLAIEAEVEDEHLVPRVERGIVLDTTELQELWEGNGRDEAVVGELALVGNDTLRFKVDAHDALTEEQAIVGNVLLERVDIFDGSTTGIGEVIVIGCGVALTEVGDYLLLVGIGEEAAHGIAVERVEVAGVELLVVGDEELLGDATAKLAVEHITEVGILGVGVAEEVVEAVDELLLRQLVDVLLEGEVHIAVAILYLGMLAAAQQRGRVDMLADELLHLGIAEMEEVAGVVPHEAILLDGLAIATDGTVGLDDAVVAIGKGGIAEPGGSSAYYNIHVKKD